MCANALVSRLVSQLACCSLSLQKVNPTVTPFDARSGLCILQRLQRPDIVLRLRLLAMDRIPRVANRLLIVTKLAAQVLPRLGHQMPMAPPLHAPLQAQRDQPTQL
jgi:hypothetical protein